MCFFYSRPLLYSLTNCEQFHKRWSFRLHHYHSPFIVKGSVTNQMMMGGKSDGVKLSSSFGNSWIVWGKQMWNINPGNKCDHGDRKENGCSNKKRPPPGNTIVSTDVMWYSCDFSWRLKRIFPFRIEFHKESQYTAQFSRIFEENRPIGAFFKHNKRVNFKQNVSNLTVRRK